MALKKEKMTDFGISADYWKIGMVSIDRNAKEASYSLNLYFDKDASQFIETFSVSLLGMDDKTQYNEYFDNRENIISSCYLHAKTHVEFFRDAIDEL